MTVGYRLYREIRDLAPAGWSPAELVTALMIADDARDETRRSFITTALLSARTRLEPVTVRGALSRLARAGYEFRVPFGTGRDGRPVFAARNHRPEYLVPDIGDIRARAEGLSLPYSRPP